MLQGKRRILFLSLCLVLVFGGCASTPEPDIPEEKPIDTHKLSRIYSQMGAAYLAEGHPRIAIKELKKALELDPDNAEAHGTIAVLYEELKMFDKARKHYVSALKLQPDDPRMVNNFGRFLCEQGEHGKGLKLLARAADDRLYGNRWIPMVNAGECALAVGDLVQAETWLRQALDLNPNSPNALAAMARLKARQGKYLSARAFLQRYEAQVKEPDQSLLQLGVEIETALGDSDAVNAYRMKLRDE